MKVLIRLGIVLTTIWALIILIFAMIIGTVDGVILFVILGLLVPSVLWGISWIFAEIKNKKVVLVLLVTTVGMFFCRNYINKYLISTRETAILNAKWGMSPEQINEANNAKLYKPDGEEFYISFMSPKIADKYRYEIWDQDNIYLYDHLAKIEYTFFDNMLYDYLISIKITEDPEQKEANKILSSIKKKYGEGTKLENNRGDEVFTYEWIMKNRKISCSLYNENDGSENIIIRVLYIPIYEKIVEESKPEEGSFF